MDTCLLCHTLIFDERKSYTLDCKHVFHRPCLANFLNIQQSVFKCPECGIVFSGTDFLFFHYLLRGMIVLFDDYESDVDSGYASN